MDIVKSEFKAWLETHKPEEIVGFSVAPRDCPIARFCTSKRTDGTKVRVTSDIYRIFNEDSLIEIGDLPEWTKCFVMKVDCSMHNHSPVIAAQALEHLSTIWIGDEPNVSAK